MTKSERVLSLEVILSLEKSQIVISPCLTRSEAHDLMMEKTPTNTTLNIKHILLRIILLNGLMWCLCNLIQAGIRLSGFHNRAI